MELDPERSEVAARNWSGDGRLSGIQRQFGVWMRVTDDYLAEFAEPDVDGVVRFLCEERIFSRDPVTAALARAFPPAELF